MVLLHQSDLHTSNPTMVLACLVALMNKDIFLEGAFETLPFIQNLSSHYPYTALSVS